MSLTATSFDSESDLFSKYPESVQILQKMRDMQQTETLEVQILHNIDATRICETLPGEALSQGFDEVTFCHPHIGSEDLCRNSALVAHFFHSAKNLSPKVIQLTLLQS